MKPELVGILRRTGIPTDVASNPGGACIQIPWSQVEPTEGQLVTSSIDKALSAISALKLRGKLRVMGGIDAPGWLQQRVGTVANYVEGATGVKYTIPRAWDARYTAAYGALHQMLAAKYDADDRLAVNVAAPVTAVYDEPFQFDNPPSAPVLTAAGYSDNAFITAMQAGINAHKAWANTPTALAFNDFKSIHADGSVHADFTVPDQIMGYLRVTLGPEAIIENNSWRTGFKWTDSLYALFPKHGGPLCLQTAGAAKITDMVSAMDVAVSEKGLRSIEMPGGNAGLTAAQVAHYQGILVANAGSAPAPAPAPKPPARRVGAVDRRKPGGTRP